jgi:hypothetical protein
VDGRDRATEDVIISFEYPEAFDGEHIKVVLDDTEEARVARSVHTDRTDRARGVGESETRRTFVDIGLQFFEFSCEVPDIGGIGLQQKKREFGRGLLPDAGHVGDEIDETFKGFWHRNQLY